jgi:hypothetical protein
MGAVVLYNPRVEGHRAINADPATAYKGYFSTGLHQWLMEAREAGFIRFTVATVLPLTGMAVNDVIYIEDTGEAALRAPSSNAQLWRFDGLIWQGMFTWQNPNADAQWAAYFAIASGAVLGRHIEVPLTASTGTTVLHSFGAYPQVSFVQANGDELGAFGKTHDSQNQLTVAFNAPVTGTLVLDLGSTAVAPAILVVSPPMTTI